MSQLDGEFGSEDKVTDEEDALTRSRNVPREKLFEREVAGRDGSLQDMTLYCRVCCVDFIHDVQNQRFFAKKGFNTLPGRCVDCRRERRELDLGRGLQNLGSVPRTDSPEEVQRAVKDAPLYCQRGCPYPSLRRVSCSLANKCGLRFGCSIKYPCREEYWRCENCGWSGKGLNSPRVSIRNRPPLQRFETDKVFKRLAKARKKLRAESKAFNASTPAEFLAVADRIREIIREGVVEREFDKAVSIVNSSMTLEAATSDCATKIWRITLRKVKNRLSTLFSRRAVKLRKLREQGRCSNCFLFGHLSGGCPSLRSSEELVDDGFCYDALLGSDDESHSDSTESDTSHLSLVTQMDGCWTEKKLCVELNSKSE